VRTGGTSVRENETQEGVQEFEGSTTHAEKLSDFFSILLYSATPTFGALHDVSQLLVCEQVCLRGEQPRDKMKTSIRIRKWYIQSLEHSPPKGFIQLLFGGVGSREEARTSVSEQASAGEEEEEEEEEKHTHTHTHNHNHRRHNPQREQNTEQHNTYTYNHNAAEHAQPQSKTEDDEINRAQREQQNNNTTTPCTSQAKQNRTEKRKTTEPKTDNHTPHATPHRQPEDDW
jgi:hypothetical protein